MDLDFNPKPQPKCAHCGRVMGEHRARTYECPIGRKQRTMGRTSYGVTVFEPRQPKKAVATPKRE